MNNIEEKIRVALSKAPLNVVSYQADVITKLISEVIYEILQAPLPEKLTAEEIGEAERWGISSFRHLNTCLCHDCQKQRIITRLLEHIYAQNRLLEVCLTDSGYLIGYEEGMGTVGKIVAAFEKQLREDVPGPTYCMFCNCHWRKDSCHKPDCLLGQLLEKFK